MAVRVKCKKCNREAKSDEFFLDPVYKMMVCPQCVKDRKMQEINAKKEKQKAEAEIAAEKVKKDLPPGWDSDDVEIERRYSDKLKNSAGMERIDDDRIKYTCSKCKYKFTYFTTQGRPGRCPYCATPAKV
ncbi:hypothetical protein JW826_03845 [Candidatus Woesearchaeota archaeon]|nr:hypothetical protein [Candidatus Woesearchaeota archaeon]